MTDAITCPRCGSAQITANARGFNAGQALAGDLVVGPIGLLAGAVGNSKVVITCLHCGLAWAAGGREAKVESMARAERRAELASSIGHRLLKIAAFIILAPIAAVLAVMAVGFVVELFRAVV